MSRIEEGLTQGLNTGYAGNSEISDMERSGIPMKRSHVESEDITYDDQWLAASTGGGQEIVRIGEEKVTRLYAGGVISKEKLEQLGITEGDVITFLIATIQEQQDKTRLFARCAPQPTQDWTYTYEVINTVDSVSLTVGMEKITYKGIEVFAHGFLICSIT